MGEPDAIRENGGGRHRDGEEVVGQRIGQRGDVGGLDGREEREPGGQEHQDRIADDEGEEARSPYPVRRPGDRGPRAGRWCKEVVIVTPNWDRGPRAGRWYRSAGVVRPRSPWRVGHSNRRRASGDQRREQEEEQHRPELRPIGRADRGSDGRRDEDPRHERRHRRHQCDEPVQPQGAGPGRGRCRRRIGRNALRASLDVGHSW